MTPDIDHRYARAIAVWDVHEGRDRNGFLPEERRRYEYWRKAGGNLWVAYDLLEEESHER